MANLSLTIPVDFRSEINDQMPPQEEVLHRKRGPSKLVVEGTAIYLLYTYYFIYAYGNVKIYNEAYAYPSIQFWTTAVFNSSRECP